MTITAEKKKSVIEQYRRDEKDTGSPEVQVSILTERIVALTDHMRSNRKDFSSRRGLLTMVSKRRRLLNYLARHNRESYKALIEQLGLRK